MVLDLVQGVLDLPPLGVEGGKLPGRCLPGVEEGGDQPVDGAVITGWAEGVLDHPHPLGVRAPVVIPRGNDLRQVGAVVEGFKHREYRGGADPPQQVRSARFRGPPQVESAKAPVGQDEHAFRQCGEQPLGQSGLVERQGADLGREHGMGAALDQGRHPRLRIRTTALPTTGPGTPEELGVRRGIRDIEDRAVHRDQSPSPVPGALRVRDRDRPTNPAEQGP